MRRAGKSPTYSPRRAKRGETVAKIHRTIPNQRANNKQPSNQTPADQPSIKSTSQQPTRRQANQATAQAIDQPMSHPLFARRKKNISQAHGAACPLIHVDIWRQSPWLQRPLSLFPRPLGRLSRHNYGASRPGDTNHLPCGSASGAASTPWPLFQRSKEVRANVWVGFGPV